MDTHTAFFAALTLIFSSSGLAQTKSHYPVCWVPLLIGEVPDLPFSARLVPGTFHQVGAELKVSEPETLGFVARDSKGRVMVRVRKAAATSEEEMGGWQSWQETICDPTKETVTYVQYRTKRTAPQSETLIPSDAEGTGFTRINSDRRTTAIFVYWHNVVKGRDNLGPETFEGQSAFRYRLIETRDEKSIRDVVNSDELFAQLAQTTWDKYPKSENEVRLTEIHRGEPSPMLFYFPAGVRVPPPESRK